MNAAEADQHLATMRSMRNTVNRVIRSFGHTGDDRRASIARRDAIEWAIQLMAAEVAQFETDEHPDLDPCLEARRAYRRQRKAKAS